MSDRTLKGGVTVTMLEDSTLVRLDFGAYGSVDVPPEVAMSFVCDQGIRDRIRVQAAKAHAARQRTYAEAKRNGTLVTAEAMG